jgi:ABC-2 type transport system permease protein
MSATTAARSASAQTPMQVSSVTQRRVLASEWIKMRSLRSTILTLAAAVVAMVVLAWLVGWATNAHWSSMHPDERASFNPIDRSLAGVNLAQLAIGVLGVLLVTGEYATGMIRATFAAAPRRLPVLWAKAALYAVVTFVLLLVSAFAAFVIGQHFLASHGTTLGAPHAWRAIMGVAGYLTLVGVLAVAFGFMIRSTAGGIATLFGLLLVVPASASCCRPAGRPTRCPTCPATPAPRSSVSTPIPARSPPAQGCWFCASGSPQRSRELPSYSGTATPSRQISPGGPTWCGYPRDA